MFKGVTAADRPLKIAWRHSAKAVAGTAAAQPAGTSAPKPAGAAAARCAASGSSVISDWVEESCLPRASSSPETAGAICSASCLPSSTPHWSKLSIPHTTPSVKVMCSYSAISSPTTRGLSSGAMIDVVGRFPGKTRAETIASGVPSARTSFGRLAERQCRRLGEEVGQEQPVYVVVAVDQRVGRVGHRDEVGRDHPGALVDQLVEGVLAVGARLAPEHLAGVGGDRRAVVADALAVGLHGQLLEIRGEAVQILRVRQHGVRRGRRRS